MFKKLLASVGIGSASVDLEVANSRVELGGILEGQVHIKGGNIEQEIDQIYINLVLSSKYKHGDETRTISRTLATTNVGGKQLLKPGQEELFPVKFQIPIDVPISKGRTKYHLQTGLDIQQAIDPSDHDVITVVPNQSLQLFFDALDILGFREQYNTGDYNGKYQEFGYKPTSFMARELDEIEIYPAVDASQLNILMQIDKRNRGLLAGLMDDLDLDERYVRFSIPQNQMNSAAQVAEYLKSVIESEYKKMY